jgi:hypothetical protein
MVVLAGFGFTQGHPELLAAPYNQFGHPCGVGNLSGWNYLYWYFNDTGLTTYNLTSTICIQDCPQNSSSPLNCSYEISQTTCDQLMVYESTPLAGRLCIPGNNTLSSALDSGNAFSSSILQQGVSDIMTSWWVLLLVAGLALVFGFLYMFMMRFCSGVVTWGLIIFYFVAVIGFGVVCYGESSNPNISINPEYLSALAYISWGVAGISLLLFCIFYRRIELAIAVLKCSSEFVENVPTTLMIPPFFFLLSSVFYGYWLFSTVFIIGTNQVEAQTGGLPFASVQWTDKSYGMLGYYVFGLLWNHAFLAALPQFVIASACCIWYFCQGSGKEPKSPVGTSISRGLFYHLGSIAFGAFVIAVIDVFRIVVNYFEVHMRNARDGGIQNCCFNYCLTCSNCCLDCFERFMKFINRHAYIQIAMTGESFCQAAQDSFYLALRNAGRFATVHGIGALFVFFGQIFITFVASIIGYAIITQSTYFQQALYSPITPMIFFILVSLIIAHVFMSVYGVSADTIIHCFCMDEEMNTSAQNTPPALREFVDNHVSAKLIQ